MDERTLDALEYGRVRETIAGNCMSEEGRDALVAREPLADPAEIARLKGLCSQWQLALSSGFSPELRGWPPVRALVARLAVEGAALDLAELYALGLFCSAAATIRAWAVRRAEVAQSSRNDALASGGSSPIAGLVDEVLQVPDLSGPEAEAFRVVDRSGELRDLPELRAIRQSIKSIRDDVGRLVSRYLSDDSLRAMLQSTVPALRDGRQVIALRANFRGRVRGIVHEVSQSGQTVYVEPEDVVDRNNDLVAEEHRLAREVQRVLREATARIAPSRDDLVRALDALVFLDGIGAAARWGHANRCVFARDPEPGASSLQIRQARHPLLGSRAVPIDLVLAPGARVLIVTGPNTGGKTVTLKTCALFALLNQTGWPIPAAEPTAIPVFDYVGCDIGDEQSLDQSLSTFSGHMRNISGMLARATGRSLVILDELASGTDPEEGSAIAMAVLDELIARGSLVLATTHHGLLKNYGYTHRECVNASVDFDEDTLSPTYRIVMGVPGESHALEIAARNGLDPAVVSSARSYLVEERADVSALIRGLTAKHEELSVFEKEKTREERLIREKRREVDLASLALRQKEAQLREQGLRRMSDLLDRSRKELENLVRELREGELTREKTVQVKTWLAALADGVDGERAGLEADREEIAQLRAEAAERARERAAEMATAGSAVARAAGHRAAPGRRARRAERAAEGLDLDLAAATAAPAEIAPGREVYVGPTRRLGTVVRAAKKGSWVVAVDSLKLTVPERDLAAVPERERKAPSVEVRTELGGDEVPAFELRLIGMRHDEAMKALERQLDLAAMKGLNEFSIVHGKGHGILQQGVHDALARSPVVSEYHFARPEDGGTGKTIVRIS